LSPSPQHSGPGGRRAVAQCSRWPDPIVRRLCRNADEEPPARHWAPSSSGYCSSQRLLGRSSVLPERQIIRASAKPAGATASGMTRALPQAASDSPPYTTFR
jgi:hypothetical protein